MTQSSYPAARRNSLHVAIIVDGNSRPVRQRGMARLVGHRAGTENARGTVSAFPDLGIRSLLLYALPAVCPTPI